MQFKRYSRCGFSRSVTNQNLQFYPILFIDAHFVIFVVMVSLYRFETSSKCYYQGKKVTRIYVPYSNLFVLFIHSGVLVLFQVKNVITLFRSFFKYVILYY